MSYFLVFVSVYWSTQLTSLFFFLMIRRPPRSTRTDTLFPCTTLFRSNNDLFLDRIFNATDRNGFKTEFRLPPWCGRMSEHIKRRGNHRPDRKSTRLNSSH